MLRRILNYSFSILVGTTLSSTAFSQKKIVLPSDTIIHKYLPTGLRLGTDAISIIKSKVTNNFKGYEFNGDLDFDRYYLAVDYGYWARDEQLVNGRYTNGGNYFRIGSDINFMLKDPEKNMFFLGFRYGVSRFKESLSYNYSDSLPMISGLVPRSVDVNNKGLTAHWIEFTIGLRVKIWGPFWMGYTARLKLAPSVKGDNHFNTFDIPGYGLYEKSNYWGINYQLFWRIPIRKAKGLHSLPKK